MNAPDVEAVLSSGKREVLSTKVDTPSDGPLDPILVCRGVEMTLFPVRTLASCGGCVPEECDTSCDAPATPSSPLSAAFDKEADVDRSTLLDPCLLRVLGSVLGLRVNEDVLCWSRRSMTEGLGTPNAAGVLAALLLYAAAARACLNWEAPAAALEVRVLV